MTKERAFDILTPMKNIETIRRVVEEFAAIACVESVAVAGSLSSGHSDADSDVDLYVYGKSVVPVEDREIIARKFAFGGDPTVQLDNRFWEPGDEWVEASSGVAFDIMYRTTEWIAGRLDAVLVRHEPSLGYTTCFIHNVRHSECLFDRNGFYAALQARADMDYPEELKKNIVAHNYFVLRELRSSYLHQLELAVRRGDGFSVLHRIDEILKSVFDILFAVNRAWHPGEKRILQYARELCPKLPERFEARLERLLAASGIAGAEAYEAAADFLDALDDLLRLEAYLP